MKDLFQLLITLMLLFCSIYFINEDLRTIRVKKELMEYVHRYNTTNSLAVESAMQDSINTTLIEFLKNNY